MGDLQIPHTSKNNQYNSRHHDHRGKIIIAFDMCNTILSKSADYETINMLSQTARTELPEPGWIGCDWTEYMQKVYNRMKQENIQLADLKKVVEEIPLNDGFAELFEFMRSHRDKFEGTIISGANTLYIKWIIDRHGLNDIFTEYYSNCGESEDSCLLKIKHYHYHSCKNCDKSICKRIIFKQFLDKHAHCMARRAYVGDSDNDYCPSTLLEEKDFLFARNDFYLHKMLFKENLKKNLKCNIQSWTNGRDIVKVLKNLI